MLRLVWGVVAVFILAGACADSGGSTRSAPAATVAPTTATTAGPTTTAAPTTTVAPTATVAPTTTTTTAPTTTSAGPVISLGEPGDDGFIEVEVNAAGLEPLFDSFNPGDDPFYLLHTQQDDVFIGIELYTVFGDGWTGELGTFPADCTTHGLCVYLDPDGSGPLPGMGPGEGTITVERLEGSTVVTLDDLIFTDDEGQAFTIVGLTLGE